MTDGERLVWAAAYTSRLQHLYDFSSLEVPAAFIGAAQHARDVVTAMRASVAKVEAHPGLDADVATMLREMTRAGVTVPGNRVRVVGGPYDGLSGACVAREHRSSGDRWLVAFDNGLGADWVPAVERV